MTKKRHLIHSSSYYPPHLGGQENAAHDLAQHLALAGHRVDVLASAAGGGPVGKVQEGNAWVRRLRCFVFGHAPVMPGFLWALLRTARRGSLVHLHVGQAFTPEMVWLASRLKRFKYIAELHIDFEPSGPAGFLLPLYKRFVLKRVLRSASAVIVLNEKTGRLVRTYYSYTGPVRLLSNGIDERYFNVGRLPLPVRAPDRLKLLFVGRFSKQKNLPVLLEALARTSRPVQLDVIGDGEERPAIETALRKWKLDTVRLHGRIDRDAVLEFYKNADVLVMPSLYEAQPLVLLEAMAARIPIIGTRVIGVEEHLQGIGIVVPPTAEGLVEAIERYYADYAKLAAMVETGYKAAARRRWRHLLKEYEALYEEVLAA